MSKKMDFGTLLGVSYMLTAIQLWAHTAFGLESVQTKNTPNGVSSYLLAIPGAPGKLRDAPNIGEVGYYVIVDHAGCKITFGFSIQGKVTEKSFTYKQCDPLSHHAPFLEFRTALISAFEDHFVKCGITMYASGQDAPAYKSIARLQKTPIMGTGMVSIIYVLEDGAIVSDIRSQSDADHITSDHLISATARGFEVYHPHRIN